MPASAHIPDCPFCGAAWTAEMLAQYDAMSAASGCACCAGPGGHHHEAAPAPALPVSDLCCATCGRAIYQAPA